MFTFNSSSKQPSTGKESLLTQFSAKSSYAESYRTLRTNLHFSLMDKELRSLVVTSSLQAEGKSNTVANLGYTLAQAGKRVLMVDADLRKPGLTARFTTQKDRGLSTLISSVLGEQVTQGKISDYGLRDLIKLTSLQKRTCGLNLKDKSNEAELFFLKGELVDIYWKNRPDSKRLANTLIKEKILTKDEANLALGHQKKSVRRLGAILQAMGLLTEKELQRILSIHMMEAFRVTTVMLDGAFSFRSLSESDVLPAVSNAIDFENLYDEFLAGETESSFIQAAVDNAIFSVDHENLFLLPSGSVPPNPSELIGSSRTSYLLSLLKHKFDVVIIDTSPVMPASDALLLAPQTDGVVLVVQSGGVEKKILKDVVQQLEKSKSNILGVTLNKADRRKDGYYKYYRSYYGS